MKHYKFLLPILLGTITLGHSACKKVSTAETKTQLLTEKNWKLTALSFSTNSIDWEDGYSGIFNCKKDDILSFQNNFTYTVDEGNTICEPTSPQITRQGTWNFLESETKLYILDTIVRETVEIKQLDKVILKTLHWDTIGSTIHITEKIYTH